MQFTMTEAKATRSKWKYPVWLALSMLFLAGFLSGGILSKWRSAEAAPTFARYVVRQGGYRFINPLLECESGAGAEGFKELKPFKYKVESLVQEKIQAGAADEVSVYFRDLNNGPWFGIDEKKVFAPASLMKVPVMMAYFRLAESHPEILTTKVQYVGNFDANTAKAINSTNNVDPGTTYTIDELIFRMLAHSDNNAFRLLVDNIDPKLVGQVLTDLNVAYVPDAQADFMSVKSYAGFYRVLYNSSYLSKEMSERALLYLSHEDFKSGIMAGVPSGTVVASKFGERSLEGVGAVRQLHEFAIVYYVGQPYLLGIMTRGSDLDSLAGVLRDISRLIYQEVDSQRSRTGS